MHPDLLETRLAGERMRRLPQEHEPPLSWEEFKERTTRPLAPARSMLSGSFRWHHAALAAGIALAVTSLAIWGRVSLLGAGENADARAARVEPPMMVLPDRQPFAQAEASERWLARLPAEPAVVRVGTRTAVAGLEDRIAWMDDVLSAERLDAVDQPRIFELQRERARLINSLAQVRYAETLVAAAQ